MQRFAFIIHPIEARRDVARRYPLARFLPEPVIEKFLESKSPQVLAHITGLRSLTGAEAEGWFIACPLTPKQMLSLPIERVWMKLQRCGEIAASLGAKVLGLGAFTSVIGDGGVTLASRLPNIAVTTGNSYTVATAVEAATKAAEMVGIRVEQAKAAVVGATGSIGATCAELLARDCAQLTLVGRNEEKLQQLASKLDPLGLGKVSLSKDVAAGLLDADLVITVTNAVDAVILPEHLKRGAVVCDVARPRDISRRVAKERNDVLVIEGGVVLAPGTMQCKRITDAHKEFSFGFPPQTVYACMAETITLALEQRYENYTLGKNVSSSQAETISLLARKHGFQLAGFRAFEREVKPETISNIREIRAKETGTLTSALPSTIHEW